MSRMTVKRDAQKRFGFAHLEVKCELPEGVTLCTTSGYPVFAEEFATKMEKSSKKPNVWTCRTVRFPVPATGSISYSFRFFTVQASTNNVLRYTNHDLVMNLTHEDAGAMANVTSDLSKVVMLECVDTTCKFDRVRRLGFTGLPLGNCKRSWNDMQTDDDRVPSFWHDLPLFARKEDDSKEPGICYYVCEIPRSTRKKYEICTKSSGNPIKQDMKNGKPREYMKGDIGFNYGAMPRTWEDPAHIEPGVGLGGDNDPLDVCEIGLRQARVGELRKIKILGVLCMIDEGEVDWKVVAIDTEDRWASELNDVEDIRRLLPGTLDSIREWWRTYKVWEGKPLNRFGFDEEFLSAERALKVIDSTHKAWQRLLMSSAEMDANQSLWISDLGVSTPEDLK